MAGQLKRENPQIQEDLVLIRALRDSNLPKFLSDDATLFKVILPIVIIMYRFIRYTLQGILSDLFPGVVLPEHDYGVLQSAIETATSSRGLQVIKQQVLVHDNFSVLTHVSMFA